MRDRLFIIRGPYPVIFANEATQGHLQQVYPTHLSVHSFLPAQPENIQRTTASVPLTTNPSLHGMLVPTAPEILPPFRGEISPATAIVAVVGNFLRRGFLICSFVDLLHPDRHGVFIVEQRTPLPGSMVDPGSRPCKEQAINAQNRPPRNQENTKNGGEREYQHDNPRLAVTQHQIPA